MRSLSVEYAYHLTGKSNGSHGHWSGRARIARSERTTILALVDRAMRIHTPGEAAFELRKVEYTGRFRGVAVQKTKMVRFLSPTWRARLDGGLTITLTRFAEKPLDDDNLRTGFKAFRDGVADAFGIRDDDKRVRFVYAQVLEPPSKITARIELEDAAE